MFHEFKTNNRPINNMVTDRNLTTDPMKFWAGGKASVSDVDCSSGCVRRTETHAAEIFVAQPILFEDDITVWKLKNDKL
jgi:hypothetical protein